ncbi:SDR family NAD(P)-dependent oxidoreductase [Geomicrobium sp. JCM 19055]|uniref:SDR family NAD(P)-dependent oxidoreductase n=1 Tax=Geomicrobium sp. JCM 19055 TaxID=1460649 RepID=UPI000694BE2B|nr:SDR family NAD(P)-dependent oxidoreductase [Geomicrobium sp. JCM 19055]
MSTKGKKVVKQLQENKRINSIEVMHLNLASLKSVKEFADAFQKKYESLSLLINNAGVMMPPHKLTEDRFELQFGVNHLGHFALTGHLLPMLKTSPHARVVTVSSLAAHKKTMFFEDLQGVKHYRPFQYYRQSKYANLLFALRLQKLFEDNNWAVKSVACHPGITKSNLLSRGEERSAKGLIYLMQERFAQSTQRGAKSILFAALHPSIHGGEYVGPHSKRRRIGDPFIDSIGDELYDEASALRLFEVSEHLTGVFYPKSKSNA